MYLFCYSGVNTKGNSAFYKISSRQLATENLIGKKEFCFEVSVPDMQHKSHELPSNERPGITGTYQV